MCKLEQTTSSATAERPRELGDFKGVSCQYLWNFSCNETL